MMELQQMLNERGYRNNRIGKVFEADDYYAFLGPNPIIWNKKSDKGVKFGKNKETSSVPFANIICAYGKTLVGSIDALALMEYRERCGEEGIELSPKLKALFDGFTEEDNPVLIKYKLKTDSGLF